MKEKVNKSQKELSGKNIKKRTKELIDSHVQKIRDNKIKDLYFQHHPLLPDRIKIDDQRKVEDLVDSLERVYDLIFPFVKKIKTSYVEDITDRSLSCAIYLLLCHVFETWRTVFLVARNGMNIQMIILIRHIIETLDLISFFICKGDDSRDLQKWFDGKLIPNKKSRKAFKTFMDIVEDKFSLKRGINYYTAKTYIYTMLSQYPHSGYCAMLESVDVFNKDFDFKKYSNFHFTKTNMGYVEKIIDLNIIEMKFVFQYFKDVETYKELDEILVARTGKTNLNEAEIEKLKKDFPGI